MFVRLGDDSVHCRSFSKSWETESHIIKVNIIVLLLSLNQAPLAHLFGRTRVVCTTYLPFDVTVPAFDRFCLLRDASPDAYCLPPSAYWFENRCY